LHFYCGSFRSIFCFMNRFLDVYFQTLCYEQTNE
jgi:hypothetical protein